MLVDIFLLIAFASFVAIGVHSTTRPDKLLWFLGVRSHYRDYATDLHDAMLERKDELMQEYLSSIADIQDRKEKGAITDDFAEQAVRNAEKRFNADIEAMRDKFEVPMADFEKRAERFEASIFGKIVLSISPALTECIVCMSSFWGILLFALHCSQVLYMNLLGFPIIMPFAIFALAGVNAIFSNFMTRS